LFKLLISAAVLGLGAPALAQQPVTVAPGAQPHPGERVDPLDLPPQERAIPVDPRDEELIRGMPNSQDVGQVGEVASRAADAILDVPIGPLREAIEGRRLSREREETLGQRAAKNDPYFRDRMRDQIDVATVAVGALAEQMAVMTPVLRRTIEDVEQRIEDAAHGLPPRN
jgi:hypothetical protein